MQRVLVLDKKLQPLMPCHPARARALLRKGKAAVYRQQPFTIMLKEREGGETQPLDLKLNPGSKVTAMALVGLFQRGAAVVWAGELQHRGAAIRASLDQRRALRRGRRSRHTRYRAPRFLNRTKPQGWLAPSLHHRVATTLAWVKRLLRWTPVSELAMELVRFDTHALHNPEVQGVEYQQGTLFGYEVREYLLEKWHRRCAYCGETDLPLEMEHIQPRSRGGSDRVANLVAGRGRAGGPGMERIGQPRHPALGASARSASAAGTQSPGDGARRRRAPSHVRDVRGLRRCGAGFGMAGAQLQRTAPHRKHLPDRDAAA